MIICIIIRMNCKRLLQKQDLHGVLTAPTRRAHNAHLGDLHFSRTLWKRCKDATLVWQGLHTHV